MTELAVSISIFAFVGVTMVMLVVAAARASHDGLWFVSSESDGRNATDYIRRQTLVGQYLSVRIQDDGRRLIFVDPVRELEAQFQFHPEQGVLSFYEESEGLQPGQVTLPGGIQVPVPGGMNHVRSFIGLEDVRFSLNPAGNLLRFEVVAPARNSFGVRRPVLHEDEVLLRNLPPPGAQQFPPN